MSEVCNVTKRFLKKSASVQKISEVLSNLLKVNKSMERFTPFINGLTQMIELMKTDTLQMKIHNLDNVADNADDLIKELTLGRYEKMSDLQYAPDGYDKFLEARITAKIGAYAATIDDPDTILTKKTFDKDFANVLKFMYNYKNKANRTLFGFFKLGSLKKINIFASNFGKTFKQHPGIYKAFQQIETIGNTMTALTSAYHTRLLQIMDEAASHGFSDIMPTNHLSNLARFTDPSIKAPSEIDTAIRKYLTENDIEFNEESMPIIHDAIKRFRSSFNKLNYGFEDMSKYTHNVDGRQVFTPEFYQKISSHEANEFDNTLNIDGQSFPPILRSMSVLGKQLASLIEAADMHGPDGALGEIHSLFTNLGNREQGGLEFRQNYMPGKGEEDFMSNLISMKKSDHIYLDTEILRERKIIDTNPDTKIGVVDVMTNNLKAMRHMFKKASTIAGAGAIRKIVQDTGDVTNNEGIQDVLTTAKYFSDKILDKQLNTSKKEIPLYVKTMKKYANAVQALVAGLCLTTSGVSNRFNAAITRWLEFGMLDSVKIKNNFNNAMASQDDIGKIARAIDFKYNAYYNQGKVSDFLMKRSDRNFNAAFKGLQSTFDEKLPEMLQKYGERNMTHVLGLFKLGKWNFNASEGVITDLRKFYMFDLISKAYKAKAPSDTRTPEEFFDDHFKAMNDEVYLKTKEANGDWESEAKPFWSHEMLENAETGRAVLFGTMLSIASMFKSVAPVNADVGQRLLAGIGNALSVSKLSTREYNSTAALGLLAMAVYGVIDKIMDEDMKVRVMPVLNVNPMGETTDTLAGLMAIYNILTNQKVSGRTAKHAIDLMQFPFGMMSKGFPGTGAKISNDEQARFSEFFGRLNRMVNPVDTISSLWYGITEGIANDDPFEFRNSFGRPDFFLLLNDSNKVLKLAKKATIATNFIVDGIEQDNDAYIKAGIDTAASEFLNLFNLSWRVHKTPYQGYNYATQAWKYRSQYKYYTDYQAKNLKRLTIAQLKDAQQKQQASAALLRDMDRKFNLSKKSQILRDLQYMNDQFAKQYQYRQIQELYES